LEKKQTQTTIKLHSGHPSLQQLHTAFQISLFNPWISVQTIITLSAVYHSSILGSIL